jgi:hypothetical protein
MRQIALPWLVSLVFSAATLAIGAERQAPIEEGRSDLGDFHRISSGARLSDAGPRRPGAQRRTGSDPQGRPLSVDGGGPYPRSFVYGPAIDHEPGVTRRDPSDVIRVDDRYHVWYSRVAKQPGVWGYPSGYSADVFHASSPDGKKWTEQGLAVGKGEPGAWDEHGVFTPNILAFSGKFYLYYTGVPRPFDKDTKTAIGMAVSDTPDGPWSKVRANPILVPSRDPGAFDSMRVDDASLLVRDGLVWLYYKGRQLERTPGQTKMGLATAKTPEGPYGRHPANPLHAGHEVLVWPQGTGVASMATAAGPKRVYFAADGIRFEQRNPVTGAPRAPGCFRSDDFLNNATGKGMTWGISHVPQNGDLHLARFDCR